jgi:5-methylcytosine-specific restriction protein A
MSGRWATSHRRDSLPRNWARLRAYVHRRDHGVCQWPAGEGICGGPGRDVDHRYDPADHRPESLWLLCGPHHDAKTQAEARAGRILLARPAEPHPGLNQA